MVISKKVAAIGAAGIVALGGAGLYAGSLTVTAPGALGAGSVAIQASCASAAAITPGASTWNPATEAFEFSTLVVDYTVGSGSCLNQEATVNVYNTTNGSELSTNATPYPIDADDVTATAFTVTLDDPVDASINPSTFSYGLLIQAP